MGFSNNFVYVLNPRVLSLDEASVFCIVCIIGGDVKVLLVSPELRVQKTKEKEKLVQSTICNAEKLMQWIGF